MADFFSNLFDAIQYIPNKLGEMAYNMGLPEGQYYGKKKVMDLQQQLLEQKLSEAKRANDIKNLLYGNSIEKAKRAIAGENDSYNPKFAEQYSKRNNLDNLLGTDNVPFDITGSALNQFDVSKPINNNQSLSNAKNIADLFQIKPKTVTQDYVKVTPTTREEQTQGYQYNGLGNLVTPGQDPDMNGDANTAKAGEVLINELGKNGINATVNSFFRDPDRNASVGGSPTSNHLSGKALDLNIPNDSERAQAADTARNLGFGEVLDEGDHLHVGNFQGALPRDTQTKQVTDYNVTKGTRSVNLPGTGDLEKNRQFSNLLMDNKAMKYVKPAEIYQLAQNNPELFIGAGMTPDDVKLLALNPEQRQLSSLIKGGLMQSADQRIGSQQAAQKNLGDMAIKLQKAIIDENEFGVKYGNSAESVNEAQNRIDTAGSIYGISPGTFKVSRVKEPGTERVKLQVTVADKLNAMENRNIRTNNDSIRTNNNSLLTQANLGKIGLQSQKLLQSLSEGNKVDPFEMEKAGRLYSNKEDGLLDVMANMNPVDRQQYFENNKKTIYSLGVVSGKSEQQIYNDLLSLGVIKQSKEKLH